MDREEIWRVVDAERASLADLFGELSPAEWATPSLCAGWRVREVAAHLTLAQTALPAAAVGLLRARGSFNGMIRDTAIRQARLPVEEYGPLLRAMVGSRKKAPGITDLEPLMDVLVHGQDIALPLGRTRPVPPVAAAAAATRAWSMGFPFHARRRLRGVRLVATDCGWTAGDGAPVEGSIAALLLLLTGRTATLDRLTGPGADALRARLASPPRRATASPS